jgi:hypothetical protein
MPERRRYARAESDEEIVGSHHNGGQDVSATVVNISIGGAFIHAERFLAEGTELTFVAEFPRDTLRSLITRALCRARVLRLEKQLVEGKFGIALRFLSIQALPEV